MKIKWHGNTCFAISDKDGKVVINPNKEVKKLTGDIVLSSLKEEQAEVAGVRKVLDWPGEYEIQGIPIIGFQAWTKSRSTEEEKGEKGDPTIIFYFEIGKLKCCHLGDLGHVLTSDMVKQIGDVDILMINIGENSNLSTKKAMEIVESIEPRVLIPMGEGDLKGALKEFGAENIEEEEVFVVKSRSELPEDKRKYILLKKE